MRFAWIVVVGVACGSKPAVKRSPTPLAGLLRSDDPAATATGAADPKAGGAIALPDGAALTVAPGAIDARVGLTLRRWDVAPLDLDVASAALYEYGSDRDVARFAAPVALQLPGRAIFVWDGKTWRDVPGDKLAITHFSSGWVLGVEWLATKVQGVDPDKAKFSDFVARHGNDSARKFYGIGESLAGDDEQLCGTVAFALHSLDQATYDFPSGSHFRNWELAEFLHDGNKPSTSGGWFWDLTKDKHADIQAALLAQPERSVTPGRMLAICVRAMGGNVPLGVLACHNYLKEITYGGRASAKVNELPPIYGQVASRLMTWRTGDRSPAGEFDKMGPLYHLYAAATAGIWSAAPVGASAAENGEALLRIFAHGGDRADPEKGKADDCGKRLAFFVRGFFHGDGALLASELTTLQGMVGIDAGEQVTTPDASTATIDAATLDAEALPDAAPGDPWVGAWHGTIHLAMDADGTKKESNAPMTATITRAGDRLTLTVPGAPKPSVLDITSPTHAETHEDTTPDVLDNVQNESRLHTDVMLDLVPQGLKLSSHINGTSTVTIDAIKKSSTWSIVTEGLLTR